MNRSSISLAALAVLALSSHAFAAGKTPAVDARAPMGYLLTPNTSTPTTKPASAPSPVNLTKLTSAKFSKMEVNAGDPVSIKFDGVNLAAGKGCTGKVSWTAGGPKNDIYLATNGVWGTFGSKVYDTAGTYVATFTPQNYSGEPCTSDGPITATIKVNSPAPLPPSTMTKLVVSPQINPLARLISTKWDGGGNSKAQCSYILNFGDGASKKTGAGPTQPGSDEQHVYAPGTYSVSITPYKSDYDSCTLGPDAGPKTFTVQ